MKKMKPQSRMQDRARQKTDKILDHIEANIGRVYTKSPALLQIEKKYGRYMAMVQKRTESAYRDYQNADDQESKEDAKNAYMAQIRRYTIESKEYNAIIREFTQVMAAVNQQALDLSNEAMPEVYAINYDQVAEQCRKVGIKVE